MAEHSPAATASTANFDRVARIYRWAEYICYGPLLQRVRTSLLDELGDCRRALVLGDGDGRFLARFLARHREASALAVDTSAAMLRLLQSRCEAVELPATHRLRTLQSSALAITPSPDTDLVVSHFFLDCLSPPELKQLAQQFAKQLAPGARWLVSDFALPRPTLLRIPGKAYIRALYAIFGLLTGLRVSRLPPISETLLAAGFQRMQRREFAAGMLYSEMWQLGTPPNPHVHNPVPEMALPQVAVQTEPTDRPAHKDAQSDPEPAVPSMPEPDPGVFHHTPVAPSKAPSTPAPDTKKAGA